MSEHGYIIMLLKKNQCCLPDTMTEKEELVRYELESVSQLMQTQKMPWLHSSASLSSGKCMWHGQQLRY